MLLSAALLFFSGFCSWHVPLRCMLHELPDEPIGVSLLALGMPAPEDTRAYTSFLIWGAAPPQHLRHREVRVIAVNPGPVRRDCAFHWSANAEYTRKHVMNLLNSHGSWAGDEVVAQVWSRFQEHHWLLLQHADTESFAVAI